MFNKNFYPIPEGLANKMFEMVKELYGNYFESRREWTVLEPSAGKGDLAKSWLHFSNKNKRNYQEVDKVDVLEIEPELQSILASNSDLRLVGSDFMKYKTVTMYDLIIANPPFDNGARHLLKMIELAERQTQSCIIACLLNAETIRNDYTNERKYLKKKLEQYNAKYEYIENGFANAERKTDVETVIVLFKVKGRSVDYVENIFGEIEETLERIPEETGLSTYIKQFEISLTMNDIERLVMLYNEHMKMMVEGRELAKKLELFNNELDKRESLRDYDVLSMKGIFSNGSFNDLRVKYWRKLLLLPEFTDIMTQDAKDKYTQKIEQLTYLEFNMENIEMLLRATMQNSGAMFEDAVMEFFKDVTKYHLEKFSDNVHYYSGWKTNNACRINKKIIVPSYLGSWTSVRSDLTGKYSEIKKSIEEHIKVFSIVTGRKYSELERIDDMTYENDLLKFRAFQKGTIHIWYKDLKALEQLNMFCGQRLNWLPTDEEIKTDKKARDFIVQVFGKESKYLLSA